MSKVCIDRCERDDKFIEEHLTSECIGAHVCCCVCPALQICKELDDGIGCVDAKDGTYDCYSCVNCDYCTEE